MTWEFGGTSRRSDGVQFYPTGDTGPGIWDSSQPDWVWIVEMPDPRAPRWRLLPEKLGLETPQQVADWIDKKWPFPQERKKD
jgi:hypothetical protein